MQAKGPVGAQSSPLAFDKTVYDDGRSKNEDKKPLRLQEAVEKETEMWAKLWKVGEAYDCEEIAPLKTSTQDQLQRR